MLAKTKIAFEIPATKWPCIVDAAPPPGSLKASFRSVIRASVKAIAFQSSEAICTFIAEGASPDSSWNQITTRDEKAARWILAC